MAQLRVRERLDRAIELDTIVETNDNSPFSSSAVDTHAFFLQVCIIRCNMYNLSATFLSPFSLFH